jgi:hypothetical protein
VQEYEDKIKELMNMLEKKDLLMKEIRKISEDKDR